jgi:hypothetical protein
MQKYYLYYNIQALTLLMLVFIFLPANQKKIY